MKSEEKWWWLSFADPDLPTGEQFLGAVIVPGDSAMQAHMHATLAKLNPGGEMIAYEIESEGLINFPPESRMCLLLTDDMERIWPGGLITMAEMERE